MFGMGYYGSMGLLLPALILTFFAQARIRSAFNTYAQVRNSRGITGSEAARIVMDRNGLSDVPINVIGGNVNALTNYFDPRSNTVNLSGAISNEPSIAAICIACHEVGHAIQYEKSYGPIKFRNAIVPVASLTSTLSWPMIIFGLMLSAYSGAYSSLGSLLLNIGIICFLVVVLFHAVTLPIEFDASRRAINEMQAAGIVDTEDLVGSKKVLDAAALTYVAALATAIASLLRILAMTRRR